MSGAGHPNPDKLRPLTKHALAALADIAITPRVVQLYNPGLRDRLERGGLVERVDLTNPAPWARNKVPHFQITEAGRAALAASR